jgi:hypothetical protein
MAFVTWDTIKPCPCGSGEQSKWELDAQGIPLIRACDVCWPKKMLAYRPCVRTAYTQADMDEPIEPEGC